MNSRSRSKYVLGGYGATGKPHLVLQMTSRTRLKRKEIDDVLGGDEMWAHADQTQGAWAYRCFYVMF
jgi:hypothetical protein